MSILDQAFNDWYFNGGDTYWCDPCNESHNEEEECESADSFSTLDLIANGELVLSDDAADMNIWRALHVEDEA